MKRLNHRAPRRGKFYGHRSWRIFSAIEVMEARQLLCADDLDADGAASVESLDHGAEDSQHDGLELGTFPVIDAHRRVPLSSGSTSDTTTTTTAATSPLSSIPVLNSLAGAAVSVYLDFDGHFEANWGSYSNITQPAFDQDGDPTTFSDGELATIQNIWQYVAEDYSPFNVNVTTVQPGSFANGVALRVSIGGDGSWIGPYGGVAYVNSFTNSISNVVFVFPKNLANGYAKYTGEASSHESGHAFGLQHQSLYTGTTKVDEYYSGPGDGRAPIMGDSYSATRGLWWYGTSVSSTTYQDDMAVISRSTNGFGYRVDDYGNTAATASALAVSGSQLSGSGFITTTNDVDFFAFSTDAGQIGINVSVLASINDLDAKLQLFDANGSLIETSDPSTLFGASLSATVAAGSYRVAVSSHGGYGDVGQYTVSGTIVLPADSVGAPSNLVAATQSTSQINLSWIDNATNETGFRVDQSFDGVTWTTIATLGADSTSFSAVDLTAGTSYAFRVSAFNATSVSDFSNVVTTATLAFAPANLTATAISSSRIDLAWSDVSGETGYKIERSTDGTNWTQIATTGANVTDYSNTGLNSSTTYSYRVTANNAGGDSAASNVASATTSATPTLPNAPTSLTAVAATARRVNLAWTDNSSNENGFQVWRSSNNGRSWTNIANVGANATSYADNGVSARKTYSYRVRAFNDAGNSAYSSTATVTTPRASASSGISLGRPAATAAKSQSVAQPATSASHATATSARSALLSTGANSTQSVRYAILGRRETTDSTVPASSSQEEPATPSNVAARMDDFGSLAVVFSHLTLLGECLV